VKQPFVLVSSLLFAGLFLASAGSDRAEADETIVTDDPALAEARILLQAEREEIVRDEILFTKTEAEKFWPAYQEYRRDIIAVRDRQAILIADYLKAYRAGAVTASMADALVDDYLDIKQELLKVQRKHLKKLRKILPPRKVGRFFQLENKLDAETDAQLALFIPLMDPV